MYLQLQIPKQNENTPELNHFHTLNDFSYLHSIDLIPSNLLTDDH